MIRPAADAEVSEVTQAPTVWGLDPVQLHDRFWAARGVCVVRPGERTELPGDAELFMLVDAKTLSVFRLRELIETFYWVKPEIVFVRLSGARPKGYREVIVSDERGRFVRFERRYDHQESRLARVALTRDRRVAEIWQTTLGEFGTWRQLRNQTRRAQRETATVSARCYQADDPGEVAEMVIELIRLWPKPASTIPGVRQIAPGVWGHPTSGIEPGARVVGPLWLGAGRTVPANASVVGPAALWDDPLARPDTGETAWQDIEPVDWTQNIPQVKQSSTFRRTSQRVFDLAFTIPVLALTLPLYPLIMLAIWLEDGRPFFFAHRRETVGGKEFGCLKFRSMRKDADRIKQQILDKNQADGPQFFIENDPRITRVGVFLRKLDLDELPQFLNVLMGDMSVVGPRPSPYTENQYCPPWREARLSVRPGVTGLWQVSRTRQAGLDFQEWIKYDMEYIQKAGFWYDIKIILRTAKMILLG